MNLVLVMALLIVLAAAQTVHIDLREEHQTIVANGINFEGYHRSGGNEILADKFNTMMSQMPSQLVRVGVPLENWEPTNDDGDPFTFNWRRFLDQDDVNHSFERLLELDERGLDIWLAIWDAADWNISNPTSDAQRRIKEMDEFVESICAYIKHAQDEYGVSPAYVSVNEPSIALENGWGGYQIALSIEEQKQLIKKAGIRFDSLGITTKWLVAVHKVYPSELVYARVIFEDPEVRPYIGGFDFHGYGFQESYDSEMKAWGDWVQTTGLPVFCGEIDYDSQFWQRTDDDRKQWYPHGIETGKLLQKVYTLAAANGSQCWYGNYPSSDRPYRYANKHYYRFLKPGMVIIEAASDDEDILVTAGKHAANDTLVILLHNLAGSVKTVHLSGLSDKQLQWISSSENSYYQTMTAQTPQNGQLTVALDPYSINTLAGKGGSLPVAQFTVDPSAGVPPLEAAFNGSSSYDPQAHTIEQYIWDFGDGMKDSSGALVSHTYDTAGIYAVNLQVINAQNDTGFCSHPVYVTGFKRIAPTAKAPTVDGIVDTLWDNKPSSKIETIIQGSVSDSTDLSGSYAACYTQGSLYLLVEVRDDTLKNDSDDPRQDDGVEIMIDIGNDKQRTYGMDDYHFVFRALEKECMETKHNRLKHVDYAATPSDSGYRMEMVFPWQTLGAVPAENLLVGLEVAVNDDDGFPELLDARMAWNAGKDSADQDPSLLGVGQLAADSLEKANTLPRVYLLQPENECVFTESDSIFIRARASDAEGQITHVAFYMQGEMAGAGTKEENDWVLVQSLLAKGGYQITARAFDQQGEWAASQAVYIFVAPQEKLPFLFIVGSKANISDSDVMLQERLQHQLGYEVDVMDAYIARTSDAYQKAAVLISASVSAQIVKDEFTTVWIPLINMEPQLYDDLKMTGPDNNIDYGQQEGLMVEIDTPSHPVAAGLSERFAAVYLPTDLVWGIPGAEAALIASLADDPAKALIFCYEKGTQMVGAAAPARRIGFYFNIQTPAMATKESWALFDAAINWATDDYTSVNNPSSSLLPGAFALEQNYPNPFNPGTKISYHLPVAAKVTITVYNILGQHIKQLINTIHKAGVYHLNWDGTNDQGIKVTSGLYFCYLEASAAGRTYRTVRKMTLIK